MKRVVERPEPAAIGGTHPDAKRPLTAFHRITVICHDCGDVTVLDEAQLAALSAVPTFGDLTTCSDIDMMSSNADGRFVHKDGTPYGDTAG